MKKGIFILLVFILLFGLFGCDTTNSSNNPVNNEEENKENPVINSEDNKTIVIYFSRTNNTEKIAEHIINLTKADKYEIEAKIPYSDADINYGNSNSRTSLEQNDPQARPEIAGSSIDLSKYKIIYLGYPIWWGQAPKIMYTFVESYDLNGKTIIPFCTSGSSLIGTSATNLAKLSTGANWLTGKRFSASATVNEIESWIKTLNLGE